MKRTAVLPILMFVTLGHFAFGQIAPNTDFTVRLSPPGINTKTAAENDEVRCVVLKPETFAGYDMVGRIVKANKSGKLKGSTMLALRFERLEKSGQSIPISGVLKQVTNSKGAPNVDEEGHAIKTKNNYGKVAGAAAIGALIGGLTKGTKGALIGAGAGTAAAVMFVEVAVSDGADFELAPNSVLLVSASPVHRPAVQATPSSMAANAGAGTNMTGVPSFRVRHDHGSKGNNPSEWRYCEGILSMFPDHVKFEALSSTDNQIDSFEIPFADLQEVKGNFFMIMHASAFHLRSSNGATLNFVPLNNTVAEVINSFPRK